MNSKRMSQIFKILFQTGEINIFVPRGVWFSRYVQLKSSFSDSLVRTADIVTKDIGLNLGVGKCGILAMKRGKEVECNGKELKNGEEIGQIGEEGCKYLGVLEKGDICQKEMKNNRKKYFERLRATLKSKLNVSQSMYLKRQTHGWCQLFVIVLALLNEPKRM